MDRKPVPDFRTSDPNAAMEHLRASYGRMNLQGALEYEVSAEGDDRFTVSSVLLGGELAIDGICDGFTIVSGPDRYRWQVHDERGDLSSPVIFHPGMPLHVEVDHVRVDVVRFDTVELERLARLAFDNPKLHLGFDGSHPVSPYRAALWAPLVRSVADRREELHNDLIRASVYRELAVAAWGIFRFEHTSSRRPVTSRGATVAFRTAVEFIDDNAHLPITVEDVAAAAGVASVHLGQIFRYHSSPPERPQDRIRRVRLARARTDFARLGFDEFTRSNVAANWGFTWAGFVRNHRRSYGTNPRDSS